MKLNCQKLSARCLLKASVYNCDLINDSSLLPSDFCLSKSQFHLGEPPWRSSLGFLSHARLSSVVTALLLQFTFFSIGTGSAINNSWFQITLRIGVAPTSIRSKDPRGGAAGPGAERGARGECGGLKARRGPGREAGHVV